MNITSFVFKDAVGLRDFADKCEKALFSAEPYSFIYSKEHFSKSWPTAIEIKSLNEAFLSKLRHSANVYAIFIRERGVKSPWQKMYIGQRKSHGMRERITQHLIDKDGRTGSMLDKVKEAVLLNKEIGLSFIKVEPDSMRCFIEETIITKYKKELIWNNHS